MSAHPFRSWRGRREHLHTHQDPLPARGDPPAVPERAAHQAAADRYVVDDLAELRAADWFEVASPEDLGGLGLNLAELGREQCRTARYSPPTALSTCMHHYRVGLYWVGRAADVHRMGMPEADLVTGYVMDGDILASGCAAVGNDIPVALSTELHPLVQHQVADMYLALDAPRACVDGSHGTGSAGSTTDGCGAKVLAAKWQATVAANRVVDLACEVVGGSSYRRGTEFERLSREVRAARFHPGTDAFTHETVGKALLGEGGDGPRW
jgi:alkylation response protein AidB-like acyl-CoA dehydrogenase